MDYLATVDWDHVKAQAWTLIRDPGQLPSMFGSLAPGLGLLVLVLVAVFVMRPSSPPDAETIVPKGHGRGLLGWLRPRRLAWKIGSVTLELHGRHGAAIGATGSGKSTALAGLVTGRHPTLILAFDRSDPLEAAVQQAGGVIWRPTGDLGWQILAGTPLDVCDRLTASWPTGSADTGVYRSIAREAIFRAVDDMGAERSLPALLTHLDAMGGGRLEQGAREGWTARLRDLERAMGPALGNDLELGAAMRAGQTVLLQLNAFRSPSLTPLIGAVALLDALRVADEVGNFRLLIDEGGALGDRADELDALFRAGRARGVSVVIATQIASDLRKVVQQNCSAWVLFYQDDLTARRWCALRTGLEPEEFDEGKLPRLTCWVKLGGKLGRASLKPVRTKAVSLVAAPSRPASAGTPFVDRRDASLAVAPPLPVVDLVDAGRDVVSSVTAAADAPVPAFRAVLQPAVELPPTPEWLGRFPWGDRVWKRMVLPAGLDGHWLSGYGTNSTGRPKVSIDSQRYAYRGVWVVYILVLACWEARDLEQPQAEALLAEIKRLTRDEQLTVDHHCPGGINITCCQPVEHLSWRSNTDNVKLRWLRSREPRHGAAAD